MEIFISIDGVLRNTIQKLEYHYKDYYYNSTPISESIDIDSGESPKEDDDFDIDASAPASEDVIASAV